MPVPDIVYWGPNDAGESLHYGDMRKILDSNARIKMLQKRLDHLFNNAVEILNKNNASFPLVVLTCIGIETLGQIFFTNEKGQNGPFVKVCGKFHQDFPRKFNRNFQNNLSNMWKENRNIKEINNLSELLYRYLRNEMIHGFQAKGVYLTTDETATFVANENTGYLLLNPKWFWGKYLEEFNNHFCNVLKTNKSKIRTNCLLHIEKMLK